MFQPVLAVMFALVSGVKAIYFRVSIYPVLYSKSTLFCRDYKRDVSFRLLQA